jgi:hypothetical protein
LRSPRRQRQQLAASGFQDIAPLRRLGNYRKHEGNRRDEYQEASARPSSAADAHIRRERNARTNEKGLPESPTRKHISTK